MSKMDLVIMFIEFHNLNPKPLGSHHQVSTINSDDQIIHSNRCLDEFIVKGGAIWEIRDSGYKTLRMCFINNGFEPCSFSDSTYRNSLFGFEEMVLTT